MAMVLCTHHIAKQSSRLIAQYAEMCSLLCDIVVVLVVEWGVEIHQLYKVGMAPQLKTHCRDLLREAASALQCGTDQLLSMMASTAFLADSQPPNRRALAVYPIFLFYFVISWMILTFNTSPVQFWKKAIVCNYD